MLAVPKRISEQETNVSNTIARVPITEEEIRRAFDFLDFEKTGKITALNLKERVNAFSTSGSQSMSLKDAKFLLNGQSHFTVSDLFELAQQQRNEGDDFFDPVAEAFHHWLDPQQKGFVDMAALSKIFKKLGYGDDFNDTDMQVLMDIGDADKDGRISLNDFRSMIVLRNSNNCFGQLPVKPPQT